MQRLCCCAHPISIHLLSSSQYLQQLAYSRRFITQGYRNLSLYVCAAAAVEMLILVLDSLELTMARRLALRQGPVCNVWQPLPIMRSN